MHGLELRRLRRAARLILAEEALRGQGGGLSSFLASGSTLLTPRSPRAEESTPLKSGKATEAGPDHALDRSLDRSLDRGQGQARGRGRDKAQLERIERPKSDALAPTVGTVGPIAVGRGPESVARLASGVLHPPPPSLPLAELEALGRLSEPPITVVAAFAAARVLLSQNVHVLPNLGALHPASLRAMLRK